MSVSGLYDNFSECISCHIEKNTDENSVCENCWDFHEEYRTTYISIKTVNKKKLIPKEVRWAVWERDNFTCKRCGSRKNLSIDHILPESKGGQATIENCQTLCSPCNSSKGAK